MSFVKKIMTVFLKNVKTGSVPVALWGENAIKILIVVVVILIVKVGLEKSIAPLIIESTELGMH